MIRRNIAEQHCDPYYAIQKVLENEREQCLTKEEIFVRLPRDDEGGSPCIIQFYGQCVA